MTATASVTALCGAKTKNGGECQKPAGWGAPLPGFGRCKLHGGCAPSGVKAAEAARAKAMGTRYLAEVDIDPMEAMLSGVRLSAGLRESYRLDYIACDATKDPERAEYLRLELRRANREMVQNSEATIRVGVAERYVRMAERMGAALSAAIEAGLAVLVEALGDAVTPELRAKVVAAQLARMEDFEGTAEDITDRKGLAA